MQERLMPRVQTDIFNSVFAELDEGKLRYIEESLAKIAAENPGVANFISQLAKDSPERVKISTCGIIVYRLIASQLEVDAMNKGFGE